MDFANVRSENTARAIITDKTTKLKFAYRGGLLFHNCNNKKMGPCVTFSRTKEKIYDLSTRIYICLLRLSSLV